MGWQQEVDALCKQGNELQEKGDLAAAYARFGAALKLVPVDEQLNHGTGWIYVAMADVLFLERKYAQAHRFIDLGIIAGGFANPFVHLRRGQILLELGEPGST